MDGDGIQALLSAKHRHRRVAKVCHDTGASRFSRDIIRSLVACFGPSRIAPWSRHPCSRRCIACGFRGGEPLTEPVYFG